MTGLIGKLFGRYKIIEKIGEGGMATVFKAHDTRLKKHVALKIIRSDRLSPEMASKSLKRFEREAISAAQLDHPHIIKVLDYGEEMGSPYIVMELLQDGTLKSRLSNQPMPWKEAVNILRPVAMALKFAHERKIIHRDVKPSNILFNQTNHPVLSDFGIVKILDDDAGQDLSSTGFMIGTPEYMSPEQAMGKNFDHRVDIYSLGIVFYEIVTGRRPFSADTPVGILVKQASEPLPHPTRYNKDIPLGVESFLLKVLAKNPQQRYQSMSEVINAFDHLIRSNGRNVPLQGAIPTPSTGMTQTVTSTAVFDKPKSKWTQLSWLVIGGVLVTLLCLAGAGMGWRMGLFSPDQPSSTPTQSFTSTPIVVPSKITPPTKTQIPTATERPRPTTTPTPVLPPSFPLTRCNNSKEDICVYSINPQPKGLIVALIFKDELNPSELPYLEVGETKFKCEILVAYPGRLYCNGPSISGDNDLLVYSFNNVILSSGNFAIPIYVAPSPTSRKGGGGGGNYP